MKKLAVLTLLSSLNCVAYAENMALIMGISQYPHSPLNGVYKDLENARKFAKAMNIQDQHIYEFKDQQLTLVGLTQTLDKFAKSVNSDDRVFIYFSGHGANTDNGRGCDQGIVAQDMGVMYRKDFQQYIQTITNKAAKTLVFLDTCFSGGVVQQAQTIGLTRSMDMDAVQAKGVQLDTDDFPKAKYIDMGAATAGKYSCKAENQGSARGFRDLATAAKETPNYYFLGAASDRQSAIDGGARVGGWATANLLECVSGAASSQSNSGVLTMSDVQMCAQKKIDRLIQQRKEGNVKFPFNAMTLTVGSGEGSGSMPVGFTSNVNPANQKVETIALFENILSNSDQNKKLTFTAAKSQVKIHRDNLELNIKSPVDGYLTIFIAGSSGTIYQIFPDNIDGDNYIHAGRTISLPKQEGHTYPSLGPAGKNTILAVVSPTKNRFASLGLPTVNIRYPEIDNTAVNAKNIVLSALNPASSCIRTRDFGSVVSKSAECSTSYSAAMIEVFEEQ